MYASRSINQLVNARRKSILPAPNSHTELINLNACPPTCTPRTVSQGSIAALVAAGAITMVTRKDGQGNHPLTAAAMKGHTHACVELLRMDASAVNIPDG
jgi:hypothetical protein